MDRRLFLALLVIGAAVPRFAWIAAPSPALDETWSWYHIQLMLAAHDYWKPLGIGIDAPLFPAINLAMAKWIANDVWPMRLPPAVFGTLSVPLFYVIVRRLADEALARRAAVLMAVSPFFIYYAKEARPYSQLLFTCLLFTFGFFATEHLGPRSRKRRAVLVVLTVLAVASHYYALFFFAGFWAQRLWRHWRAGRRDELRADFFTGFLSGLAVSPLVFIFAYSFSRITFGYWASGAINLITVIAEMFMFTGSAGAGEDPNLLLLIGIQVAVLVLLLLPVAIVRLRRAPRPALHPVLAALWLWPPALVQGWDILTRGKIMFLPRGFIGSAPYIFTWWLSWTDAMPVRPTVRRIYQGVLLVPMLAFACAAALSSEGFAAFKNRDVIREIVAQTQPYEGQFGTLGIHFWWMAQYYGYFYRGPAAVTPLGLLDRDFAQKHGELAAVLMSLNRLPKDEGVMLVQNIVAERYLDPDGAIVAALSLQRPRLADIPCHPTYGPEVSLYCTRMILFGPARPGR
jgi:hypothetical protein